MEFNASRHLLPRFRQSTAADLCVATAAVPSDTSNSAVLQLFTERRDLMSLPVLEQERPIGLISRNIFIRFCSVKPRRLEAVAKRFFAVTSSPDEVVVVGASAKSAACDRKRCIGPF